MLSGGRALPEHPPERFGITYGIASAVIIKIHKYLFPHTSPFPDSVGPPVQIGISVRPAVQIPGVGAVQTYINKRGG
jgi:hypothetical protein